MRTSGLIKNGVKTRQCQPRHLSTALWACAKFGFDDLRGLDLAVVEAALTIPPRMFKPMETSVLVYSLAKLKMANEKARGLAVRLLDSCVGRFRAFTTQGLSNMAWGIATLGITSQSLSWKGFVLEIRRRLTAQERFNSIETAQCVWALATTHSSEGANAQKGPSPTQACALHLLDGMDGRGDGRFSSLQPNQLATAVWAIARLQLYLFDATIMEHILVSSASVISGFTPGDLDMLLCALARSPPSRTPANFMVAVADAALSKISTEVQFEPRHLANVRKCNPKCDIRRHSGIR